jgi:catechol 2,3-dioxygenase-like lactoylglutathione lyase family enzyme
MIKCQKTFLIVFILASLFIGCQNTNEQDRKINESTMKNTGLIKIKAIHHYAIAVRNIEATSVWYEEMFGFKLERKFGFPDLGVEIAHLIHPTGIRIELLHSKTQETSPDLNKDAFGAINTLGSKHVGLQVDNIHQVSEELKSKGVKILHEVTRVELAGVTNLWILDNEGNQIEIVEPINDKK